MDGLGQPREHVNRVADLGMTALALTEHGNVSSHVPLEISAQTNDIKPIFGLEAYTAPADARALKNQRKWHLTILAKNQVGYSNLMQVVTHSWQGESFYKWPTVNAKFLREHKEGLIILSGCADSFLSCSLLGGKGKEVLEQPTEQSYLEAQNVIRRFKSIFGENYFLECQQFPELKRTCVLNKTFAEFSKQLGVSLVATSDVHYPIPQMNELQKIVHAAGRGTGSVAVQEAGWEYDIKLTYPESDHAIHERLVETGLTDREAASAIDATAYIAEQCNVEIPKVERFKYPARKEELTWKQ